MIKNICIISVIACLSVSTSASAQLIIYKITNETPGVIVTNGGRRARSVEWGQVFPGQTKAFVKAGAQHLFFAQFPFGKKFGRIARSRIERCIKNKNKVSVALAKKSGRYKVAVR